MSHGDIETVHNNGKWHNVVGGTDQVSEPYETRDEAAEEGRAMAEDLAVDHVIKNPDGSVAERHSPGSEDG